ncbi:TPA: ArsR family transcriptional regulator [Candidatus Poribacteria bacterium]|nr:ArsR family transcriptional regulator [Candidatus Poribacteria bacterium]
MKKADICDVIEVNAEQAEKISREIEDDETLSNLAETFKALSDPTRIKILQALSMADLCVCDLSYITGMTVSAVSHQLRLLRAMRLVKYERVGRKVFYSLADDHVNLLFKIGLEHVREAG